MSRIDDYEADDTKSFLRACAFSHNVDQAVKGKNGRKFFQELEAALLAMPEKRLSMGTLVEAPVPLGEDCEIQGEVCALGAVLVRRKMAEGKTELEAYSEIAEAIPQDKYDDFEPVSGWQMIKIAAKMLGISMPLAWAVVNQNDEVGRYGYTRMTPERRYNRMLAWTREHMAAGTT